MEVMFLNSRLADLDGGPLTNINES
jgi:hypothetical protein